MNTQNDIEKVKQFWETYKAILKELGRKLEETEKELDRLKTHTVKWDALRAMFSEKATAYHVIGFLEQNGYTLINTNNPFAGLENSKFFNEK